MSLNVCVHCTTKFAIGVAHCPQCGNADYHEEGSVAKISRHGGASYVGERGPEPLGALAALLGADAVVVDSAAVAAAEEMTEDEPSGDEEAEHDLVAEVVPTGTIDEVITWTDGDSNPPARLLAARDAEAAKATPRSTLVAELERRLAQF